MSDPTETDPTSDDAEPNEFAQAEKTHSDEAPKFESADPGSPGEPGGRVASEATPDAIPDDSLPEPPIEDIASPPAPAQLPASNDDTADVASDPSRLKTILESLLFVADRPLSIADLAKTLNLRDQKPIKAALSELAGDASARGVVVHEVAGGWQLRTNPTSAPWVQKVLAARPIRLSRQQLETMAIVAYRQPITRPEIDEIRGVDSGATLKLLMERNLIRILGKKEEPGRPMLYGTTKEFLEFFNLKDLRDLPTLREFHELTAEHQAKVDELETDGDGAGGGGVGIGGAAAAERSEHDRKLEAEAEAAPAEAAAHATAEAEAPAHDLPSGPGDPPPEA